MFTISNKEKKKKTHKNNTIIINDDDLEKKEIYLKKKHRFNADNGDIEKTDEMLQYEAETNKYSIWKGVITEGFRKWQHGEKIYDRDKERISLYVSEEIKIKWLTFIKKNNYSTISKLIRESVNYYITKKTKLINNRFPKLNKNTIANISHALKEPLTTIKGFSQLLLENYKDDLSEIVLTTIQNIFDSSLLLENKIINILDDIKVETAQYDILLIEDDLSTIRLLTSYFESKGYVCKGVISGTRGIEELRSAKPKLILLDIILPDLSGYDLCKMIKADKKFQDIPVFLLTAIPGSEVEKNLSETNANGFILKPFDFSDFDFLTEYL